MTRLAHLRPFRLPGGEAAVREPRRVAVALLWELLGAEALTRDDLAPVRACSAAELKVLLRLLATGARAPYTTSAGRLFDGIAALAGLRQRSAFEGEAAMLLERAAHDGHGAAYELPLVRVGGAAPLQLDWRPLLCAVLDDLAHGVSDGDIAARFHDAMVTGIVAVAQMAGLERVALTGGCFQNRRLTERATTALQRAGFHVLTHHQVPPNDGGIALGQLAIAAARLTAST